MTFLPNPAIRSKAAGLTRVDLIALVVLLLVPSVFFIHCFAKASQQVSTGIKCLNNARQLAFAAGLYAGDNRDLWPGNGPSDSSLNLEDPPAQYVPRVWMEGQLVNLSAKKQADGTLSPAVSQLANYIEDKSSLRCPGDTRSIRFGDAVFPKPRDYGLNLFIGWDRGSSAQTWHGEPMGKNQVFLKTSTTLKPNYVFLFGEIHPFSIDDPAFGSHPTWNAAGIATGSNRSFHIPANYHGHASVFSMADGHTEMHHWINPRFNDPYLANGQPITEADAFWHNHDTPLPSVTAQSVVSDFKWLAEHATVPR
jgi:hypothetical protein